ncbi:MAG: recombinase family protein [Pleurocapsa sp.]
MKIVAYIYSDPLLESPPESDIWGLEVDRVYRDLGQRQQLQQLIEDSQTQPPSYLLVRRLEELGDNLQEISDCLAKLESRGIEIIATQQDYNSAQFEQNNVSKWQNNLIKLLAEIQNNQYRDRLKRGHAKNRIKALPPPGKAPYGYRRGQDKYIIDKSTAPVVKDFFEQFLLFGSLRGAVRYLEKRYGKKISPSTGKKWLTNAVYRGDLAYKNQQIISNTHAPIISRAEAAQIDRLLRRNSSLPSRTASAPRSLAGLLICQECQYSMTITRVTRPRKKTEYLYLRCHKCPKRPKCKAIAYSEILKQIIKQICIELPLAVAQLNAPNPEKIASLLTQQLQEKRNLLEQIAQLTEKGILDSLTADLRNYQLRLEIAQLEQQIAQLPPANLGAIAKAVSIPQFWLDLSESERRFYFREFIQRIEIIRLPCQKWKLQLVFIFGEPERYNPQ